MNWLIDLPPTDERRQPFLENTIQDLAYDPQAAEQLTQLPVTARAAARDVIAKMNLPEDRRTKLLDALKPK